MPGPIALVFRKHHGRVLPGGLGVQDRVPSQADVTTPVDQGVLNVLGGLVSMESDHFLNFGVYVILDHFLTICSTIEPVEVMGEAP